MRERIPPLPRMGVTVCVPVKGDRTASGFFCAHFLKLEKKISKRVLAKSVDLNLYARNFGPLFRSFFGKVALFCPRQSVEFRLAFLLVLPNTHSKHRYQRVSRLCDVSDVKTAGKPHPTPGRKHGVYKRYPPAGPMGEYCKYTAGSNRHKPYQRKDIIKRAVRTRDQISNR